MKVTNLILLLIAAIYAYNTFFVNDFSDPYLSGSIMYSINKKTGVIYAWKQNEGTDYFAAIDLKKRTRNFEIIE